jgi:hypothetical protein
LEESIRRSGVFSSVVQEGANEFRLDVALVRLLTPPPGFDMTATVVSEWRLLERASGKLLMEEYVTTPFTAPWNAAFVGNTRARKADEGAARENIREGIRRLSSVQLPASANN